MENEELSEWADQLRDATYTNSDIIGNIKLIQTNIPFEAVLKLPGRNSEVIQKSTINGRFLEPPILDTISPSILIAEQEYDIKYELEPFPCPLETFNHVMMIHDREYPFSYNQPPLLENIYLDGGDGKVPNLYAQFFSTYPNISSVKVGPLFPDDILLELLTPCCAPAPESTIEYECMEFMEPIIMDDNKLTYSSTWCPSKVRLHFPSSIDLPKQLQFIELASYDLPLRSSISYDIVSTTFFKSYEMIQPISNEMVENAMLPLLNLPDQPHKIDGKKGLSKELVFVIENIEHMVEQVESELNFSNVHLMINLDTIQDYKLISSLQKLGVTLIERDFGPKGARLLAIDDKNVILWNPYKLSVDHVGESLNLFEFVHVCLVRTSVSKVDVKESLSLTTLFKNRVFVRFVQKIGDILKHFDPTVQLEESFSSVQIKLFAVVQLY